MGKRNNVDLEEREVLLGPIEFEVLRELMSRQLDRGFRAWGWGRGICVHPVAARMRPLKLYTGLLLW